MPARCACGSRAGWRVMARNWRRFASPPWRNNAGAKPPAADSSSNGRFAPWPIAAMGKWPSIAIKSCPIAGGAPVIGKKLSSTLDAWLLGVLNKLRELILALDGPAMRKKAVVALARQLAIDLWRWRTGRANLGDLGWFPR